MLLLKGRLHGILRRARRTWRRSNGDVNPCYCPFKRGMGLDFTIFYDFPISYFHQNNPYWRLKWTILGKNMVQWTSPIDPRGSRSILKNHFFFDLFRSIFHYYIVIFQAREPRKITGRHAGKFPEYMVMIRYI